MKTKQWRGKNYECFCSCSRGIPLWNSLYEEELYDLANDVNMNINVATREEYADVIAELDGMLRAGWRSALPPTAAQ